MRAVMCDVPQELLDQRRKIGADRWDEVWDGVLHMVPSPNSAHQELVGDLYYWLRSQWTPRSVGRVAMGLNVARGTNWRQSYRVPDLSLMLPGGKARDRGEYIEGGPDVLIEVRSPGDETYQKIPFYSEIGVRELWVVDRDTQAVEVHMLEGEAPRLAPANAEGWISSAATGLELRCAAGRVEMRWASQR
ncbi:MAG: Uma2 family endonuclease [Planctomycetes bacterium]|nr:Uma2 family endonuclease [Planctomycetota bacterium]